MIEFNGKTNVYETELFWPVMERLELFLEERSGQEPMPLKNRRIICEHIRAVSVILGDSKKIVPSNTEQGYILRRLIRRVIRLLKQRDWTTATCVNWLKSPSDNIRTPTLNWRKITTLSWNSCKRSMPVFQDAG